MAISDLAVIEGYSAIADIESTAISGIIAIVYNCPLKSAGGRSRIEADPTPSHSGGQWSELDRIDFSSINDDVTVNGPSVITGMQESGASLN